MARDGIASSDTDLNLVKPEWHDQFLSYVSGMKVTSAFLKYLEEDTDAQKALKARLTAQAKRFRNFLPRRLRRMYGIEKCSIPDFTPDFVGDEHAMTQYCHECAKATQLLDDVKKLLACVLTTVPEDTHPSAHLTIKTMVDRINTRLYGNE